MASARQGGRQAAIEHRRHGKRFAFARALRVAGMRVWVSVANQIFSSLKGRHEAPGHDRHVKLPIFEPAEASITRNKDSLHDRCRRQQRWRLRKTDAFAAASKREGAMQNACEFLR